jgi:hypothetical protein
MTTNGKFVKKITIEGRRCVVDYDGVAYWVLLRGINLALSRNENEQRAIELAAQVLRRAPDVK